MISKARVSNSHHINNNIQTIDISAVPSYKTYLSYIRKRTMSLPITVIYNFHEFKTKVKPSTTLVDVLEKSCKYFSIPASSHVLVYNNKELDPSLSFRFLNLPHGVKIHIKSSEPNTGGNLSSKKTSTVNIRLQILAPDKDNSFKLTETVPVHSFSSNDTLYDVIQEYERITKCDLLDRHSYYDIPNLAKRVQCSYVPTIQTISKIVTGVDELKKAKLRNMGLVSGNHSLRLRFKRLSVSSEDIGHSENAGIQQKRINCGNGRSLVEKPKEEQVNEHAATKTSEKLNKSSPLNSSTDNSNVQIQGEIDSARDNDKLDTKINDKSQSTGIKVYKHKDSDNHQEEKYDESEYNMTIDQARAYRSMLSKMASNGPMMTKRQREALRKERQPAVTSCIIRIRFPDHTLVQLELSASKTLGDLYEILVNEVLELSDVEREAAKGGSGDTGDSMVFFELLTMHPKVVLLESRDDFKKELASHCGLGRRSMLIYREKKPQNRTSYVRKEYLQKAMPFSALDDVKIDRKVDQDKKEEKSANEIAKSLRPHTSSKKKVPKWFKLGRI